MLDALIRLNKKGVEMTIISHKTRYPYKGPKYDLHEAAWGWLEKNGFLDNKILGIDRDKIYFEETQVKKIERIDKLKCTHYIDDLPKILDNIKGETTKILYDPHKESRENASWKTLTNWNDLENII